MATKLKPQADDEDDGPPAPAFDAGNAKTIIAQTAREVISLNEQIAELQAERREARSRVKAFMKMADFNVAMRLYQLEEKDRDESIDGLRLAFEALAIGGQGEFFPENAAAEAKPRASKKPPKPAPGSFRSKTEATDAGREAGSTGKNREANPYPADHPEHMDWDQGWLSGQAGIAAEMGKAAAQPSAPH